MTLAFTEEMRWFATVLNPNGASVQTLSDDLAILEEIKATMDDQSPIFRFMIEGSVGLRLLFHAENILRSRKGELVGEELVADLVASGDVVVRSPLFFIPDGEAVQIIEDALSTEEMTSFSKSAGDFKH